MKKNDDGASLRNIFSKNLKRLRSRMNMTQMELADNAGLAPNFINDIENEKKWPSDKTIVKLVKALKTEPYQFFIPETGFKIEGLDIFIEDLSDSIALTVKERFSHYTSSDLEKETDEEQKE